MGKLSNASLLAIAGLLGLVYAHDSNQAPGHKFKEDGNIHGITGLSDTSGFGQCVELNEGQLAGICIEINGGQTGGQQGGRKGSQNGGQNNDQNGGHNGGLGAGGGNAQTTLTEILTMAGTGLSTIPLPILTQASSDFVSTVTRFTTVTTTVAGASAAASTPSSQAASQLFTLPDPSSVPGSGAAMSTAAADSPAVTPDTSPTPSLNGPAVGSSNSSPIASQTTAPSVPALAVGSPGAVASGAGMQLSDGTCNCMCLCDPGSFPLSAAAAPPQNNPTTLQTVVSAASGASSALPAAITAPDSTISLPTSLVVATGSPTIPDPVESTASSTAATLAVDPGTQTVAQASQLLTAATIGSTSISTTSTDPAVAFATDTTSSLSASETLASVSTTSTTLSLTSSASVANSAVDSPAENTATVNSININTLSLTSNLILGSLAQPTIQS